MTSTTSAAQAEIKFRVASLWLAKGKIEQAIAGYREVLKLQPDHSLAALKLNHLQQLQQSEVEAEIPTFPAIARQKGKIKVLGQKVFASHRCGWRFAIHALTSLHNDQGLLFDGYLENSFIWQDYSSGQTPVPYRQPWIGFLHNPPNMPTWFYYQDSPQSLLQKGSWKQSLDYCVGLFTLSTYHADWLREQTGKPVSALIHPSEIPELQFDFDRFIANSDKKIVQLGWWLRKLVSIYQLPIAKQNSLGYEKIKLNPAFSSDSNLKLQKLVATQIEIEQIQLEPEFVENTRELSHLPNQQYDQLLSENIGFIELYDASANTAILECIARATPLLVNPLPAVVEYLGRDYPLYFNDLTEAAEKAMNLDLLRASHDYLKTCETRQKLTSSFFLKSFQDSDVYQRIVL